MSDFLHIPHLPPIDLSQVEFISCRASGPGGQYVNKTESAIQLRFDISVLPVEVQIRLRNKMAGSITSDNILLLESQEHRSQLQNRQAVLEKFQSLLKEAAIRPKQRKKTKPTKASKERRLTAKKRAGEIKKGRNSRFW